MKSKQVSKKATPAKSGVTQSKLQKLVKSNPHFTFIQTGKVKCTLTGHEFAPTLDNFNAYLKSKSYKKGIEGQIDLSEYEQFLTPHKDSPKFLFCRLTGAKIPKKKTAIEKHVNSRKFKSRMESVLAEGGEEEEDGEMQVVEEEEEEEEIEDGVEEDQEEQEQQEEEEEEEEQEEDSTPPPPKKNGKHKAKNGKAPNNKAKNAKKAKK